MIWVELFSPFQDHEVHIILLSLLPHYPDELTGQYMGHLSFLQLIDCIQEQRFYILLKIPK